MPGARLRGRSDLGVVGSPCRGLDVEQVFRSELVRHNWVSQGWMVHKEGDTYEVSQSVALNKMSNISFIWRIEKNAVIATKSASMALCLPQ